MGCPAQFFQRAVWPVTSTKSRKCMNGQHRRRSKMSVALWVLHLSMGVFVKDFASIAEPLHVLTKKQAQFSWSEECQAAFNELKSLLTTAPILGDPLEARQHDTGHRPPVTSASALLSRRFSRVWNVFSPMEAASCPQLNRITAPHGEDC